MTSPPIPPTTSHPSEQQHSAPALSNLPAAASGSDDVRPNLPPAVKPSGPIYYTSGSGADVWPSWKSIKRLFG
jgi:hypothetical protein